MNTLEILLQQIGLFVIYILIRIAYLKKHGRDLIAELTQVFAEIS